MKLIESLLSFIAKKEVYGLLIIIGVALIIYNILKTIIHNINERGKNDLEKKRRKTIVLLIQNIIKYIMMVIVIIFILELYGVNTKSLVAGLGIVGVVVGLALQDMLKDILMGITILGENYFVVGDYVTINSFTGKVIEFGLRTTKIKNISGEVLIISNRNVLSLVNLSMKDTNLDIDIPTAYSEKTEKVEKTIAKIIEQIINNTDADEESKYLGITDYKDNYLTYGIRIHCPKDKQWEIKRETLKVIKNQYEKDDIKIRGI